MAILRSTSAVHLGVDHHSVDDDGLATLEQLKKEGEQAQNYQSVHALPDVILAAFQAYASGWACRAGNASGARSSSDLDALRSPRHHVSDVGRAITSRGRQRYSLISSRGSSPNCLPRWPDLELGRQAHCRRHYLGVLVMSVIVIAFIVFMERARRLLIQYPARQVGNLCSKASPRTCH